MFNIAKTARQNMTPVQLKYVKKYFPKSTIQTAKKTWLSADDAIRPYFSKVVGLKKVWGITATMMRVFWLFLELVWYDPEFTGKLLKMSGSWTGFETLESWGEAMKDWNKWGVKVANSFYAWSGIGGFRALVTTSIADCNNTVYTWEHVKEQWMTENNLGGFFDEDEMEAAWWNGWRPVAQLEGGASGSRDMPASGDTAAVEAMMDEYAMYTQYAALKGCKKMTEGATYGPWLTSCAKFKSMYDVLEPGERF